MTALQGIPAAVFCALFTPWAYAQDVAASASPPPPPPWTGTAQLSFLSTTGNTETSVFGVGGEVNYKAKSPWSLGLKADFARGEDNSVETMKKLAASIRSGRSLNHHTDLFVEGAYAEDIYAGIDSRIGGELGVSQKLTTVGKHLLTVEAGVGVVREARLPDKIAQDFATLRGGFIYKFLISKTADFKNQASYIANLSDSKDWRFTDTAALTAALSTRFSMKLSYNIVHLNKPPLDKKTTDTTASAAVVAKF